MINVIFTLIGFVLGWIGENILDSLKVKLTKIIRVKTIKTRRKNRVKEETFVPHISVIGESLPFFDVTRQIQVVLSDEVFLLTAPSHLSDSFPATFKQSTSSDLWLKGCSIDELGDFFQESEIRQLFEESKKEVANSFLNRTDGCFFNNLLFGLLSSDSFGRTADEEELPVLSMRFFKTDYYTHRVMWIMTKKLRERGKLPTKNLSLSQLNDKYHCFRTSLGISIVIIIQATNEILMTTRSLNSAYNDGKEWIYVAVTETISETDYDNFIGNLNLIRWIKRALWEELGLQEAHYEENSIKVYDMFFENTFYQDGITASIQLKPGVTFDTVKALKAKDRSMEISHLFTIENSLPKIKDYIVKNKTDMREQTIFTLQSYMDRM